MPRPTVVCRRATPEDVATLVDLYGELRTVGGRAERAVNPITVPDLPRRYAEAVGEPTYRVVLACIDGEAVGSVILRVIRPDPLSEIQIVQVSHLVVRASARRRGVGHALVQAAAEWADEAAVDHVTVGIYPSLREVSRFYARLGFVPVAVHRVAAVSALRRRFGMDTGSLRVDDVVRRRTRLRRPVAPQRVAAALPRRDAGS